MADVAFRNQTTGEVRLVKVGWSWTLFLFGPILGIPFFMRKFYPAAVLMIAWDIVCIVVPDSSVTDTLLRGTGIGIAMLLGMRGNQETAKYYLKHGWELAEPESTVALDAIEKWALV